MFLRTQASRLSFFSRSVTNAVLKQSGSVPIATKVLTILVMQGTVIRVRTHLIAYITNCCNVGCVTHVDINDVLLPPMMLVNQSMLLEGERIVELHTMVLASSVQSCPLCLSSCPPACPTDPHNLEGY